MSIGLVIAICLVAANLRTSLTGVGTLLPAIEQGSGLTSSWGGLLSTLPLLTFAATSPLVARASHRFGSARLLVVALVVLAAGTVVRSLPSVICLFAGTVILSAAIAFGNVLLPTLIRRNVPAHRIQGVSALYVTVMGLTAAVSSGISAPLARTVPGSWHTALAWGVAFAIAALLTWLPRTRGDRPQAGTGATRAPVPWRSLLAWQVSVICSRSSCPPRRRSTASVRTPGTSGRSCAIPCDASPPKRTSTRTKSPGTSYRDRAVQPAERVALRHA